MIPNVEFGSQCMRCGKHTARNYIFPVVWHPDHIRRFVQTWCLECIARADDSTYEMAPTGLELDRQDNVIGVSK